MISITQFFLGLGYRWQAWLAVILISVALVVTAVYRQESLFEYPCELCIYTRVWLVFIALVALVGLFVRRTVWLLRAVLLAEVLLTLGLSLVVWKLMAIENQWGGGGACRMVANFPGWARLDEWLPMVFKVQGACGPTPYVIFKISMAQGLAAVSVGFMVAFLVGLAGSFTQKKHS